MPSSSLEPRVTEQITIARLGNRGDGMADMPDGPVYVPYTLPGETAVYPGHMGTTTLGAERATNPFLAELAK